MNKTTSCSDGVPVQGVEAGVRRVSAAVRGAGEKSQWQRQECPLHTGQSLRPDTPGPLGGRMRPPLTWTGPTQVLQIVDRGHDSREAASFIVAVQPAPP